MKHTFKANKLQLEVTSPAHPKGMTRTFNNVCANPTDEQISALVNFVTMLTGEEVQGITLTNAESIAND